MDRALRQGYVIKLDYLAMNLEKRAMLQTEGIGENAFDIDGWKQTNHGIGGKER